MPVPNNFLFGWRLKDILKCKVRAVSPYNGCKHLYPDKTGTSVKSNSYTLDDFDGVEFEVGLSWL